MEIIIKGALLDGSVSDILISGNLIKTVGKNLEAPGARVVEGNGKIALPGMVNCHGHSAMTLFRGFGDDMELYKWLNEKIWPQEAKMTEEDVYWGAKLACLEMIKSGTTCFNDMYWHVEATARAVEESGMRAVLSQAVMDFSDPAKLTEATESVPMWYEKSKKWSDRISFALGPHAIYTCSAELLKWIDSFSQEHSLIVHLHLSETEAEYRECIEKTGMTPVKYLESIGVLSPRLVLAHAVWLDDDEIEILGRYGVKVVHNPASNLKLCSGYKFKYNELTNACVTVSLGTDGCASSNNLDMLEAAKLASLLQKAWRFDPTAMPAHEALACATTNGGVALGLNIGKIEPGYLADVILVNSKNPSMIPCFNSASNLIYSANGSCVDTVICDGKLLMENGYVEGEELIMERAAKAAYDLASR